MATAWIWSKWMQQYTPSVPVAVITAHGNMETAVRALKLGAFDFVSKPLDLAGLRKLVATAIKLSETSETDTSVFGPRLLGNSAAMQHLREMIARVARSQAPVHIIGESGTGKELVAKLIHESGPRRDGPFVPVNCGAIPTELMESELFGHKRGSFTGAVSDKKGLIQSAEGGTLFLDEIADLPLHMQVKLLRVIQEKAVRPIGEQLEVGIDVRILSATHKNLAQLVAEGKFREDLFYRVNVIECACRRCASGGGRAGTRRGGASPARAAHEDPAAGAQQGGARGARVYSFPGQRARTRKHPGARDHLEHRRRGGVGDIQLRATPG
jgi:two-component system, NtrC family, response regulator PilR